MKPHGRSARMNSRSAAVRTVPDTPVMKARVLIRADYPYPAKGSRKPQTILRDKALSPGGLQLGAELDGLLSRAVRPDHGAIFDLAVSQIHPPDHRRTGGQYRRVLALRHAER